MCEILRRMETLVRRMKENDSNWSQNNLTKDLNMTDRMRRGGDDCLSLLGVLDVFHTYYIPFIILVGLVGNFLSCLVFLTTHLRMRSSSYYLAALSCADFGFLVSLLFVWINDSTGVQVFNKNGWCQGLVYLSSVSSFLSVWLIVGFTVERFIAVQYPLRRPHMCTIKRAKTIIIGLLIIALITHSYSFVTAGMINVGGEEICDLREEYVETMRTINTIDSIITLILPIFLIVFMNSMITWNLVKFKNTFQTESSPTAFHQRTEFSLNRLTRSSSRLRTQQSLASQSLEPAQPRRTVPAFSRAISGASGRNPTSTKAQQNITKMLLLISTVFVLLNLPSYVIRLYIFIFDSIWREMTPTYLWCLQQVFMLLYYTNFSINFLLYSMYGITFRRCLWNMLQNKFKFLSRFSCKSD